MKRNKLSLIIGVILLCASILVLGGCSGFLERLGIIDEDDDNDDDGYYIHNYYEDVYADGRFFVYFQGAWHKIDVLDGSEYYDDYYDDDDYDDDYDGYNIPDYILYNGDRYRIYTDNTGIYEIEAGNRRYRLLGTVQRDRERLFVFDNGWACDYSGRRRYGGQIFDAYDEIYATNNPYRIPQPGGSHLPTHISIDDSYYEVHAPFGDLQSILLSVYGDEHFIYGFVVFDGLFYMVLNNGWLLDYNFIVSDYHPYEYIYYYPSISFYYHDGTNYRPVSYPTPPEPEPNPDHGPGPMSEPYPMPEPNPAPAVPTGQPNSLSDTDGDGLIEIETPAQLKSIGSGSFSLSGGYELANDIDLSAENWEPIGRISELVSNHFSGFFEGNGYRIHGLTTSGRTSALFAHIDNGAVVRNLRLEASLQSIPSSSMVGALALRAHPGSVVANVSVAFSFGLDSRVRDAAIIGGLVSRADNAFILNSYAKGSITGNLGINTIGGLIGSLHGGTLRGNLADATIDGGAGADIVGGLIGMAHHTAAAPLTMTDNYARGSVTGGNDNVGDFIGGIVGQLDDSGRAATIRDNYYSSLKTLRVNDMLTSAPGIATDSDGSHSPTLVFVEHAETTAANTRANPADCTPTSETSGALDPPICGSPIATN